MKSANCPCGATLSLRSELEGKNVRCPKCQRILKAPASKPQGDSSNLGLTCTCGTRIRIKPELSGHAVRCPKCKAIVSGTSVAPQPQASMPATHDPSELWNQLPTTASQNVPLGNFVRPLPRTVSSQLPCAQGQTQSPGKQQGETSIVRGCGFGCLYMFIAFIGLGVIGALTVPLFNPQNPRAIGQIWGAICMFLFTPIAGISGYLTHYRRKGGQR